LRRAVLMHVPIGNQRRPAVAERAPQFAPRRRRQKSSAKNILTVAFVEQRLVYEQRDLPSLRLGNGLLNKRQLICFGSKAAPEELRIQRDNAPAWSVKAPPVVSKDGDERVSSSVAYRRLFRIRNFRAVADIVISRNEPHRPIENSMKTRSLRKIGRQIRTIE